ncbi:MAG: pilus assembly protein PilS [Desulfovibrio sp.]|jgi:hypothetical protein|nr:pilus assembly protein PilS [Desulfovibrio sp.]
MSLEAIGTIFIILFLSAAAAVAVNTGFTLVKINSLEQDIVTVRMQTQSMFANSTDYSGLDNARAIKVGLVPKNLQKGNGIAHAFGGSITLSANDSNASFTIDLEELPLVACVQLAKFQPDAWYSISVNGAALEPETPVMDIVENCNIGNVNQIVFEAR